MGSGEEEACIIEKALDCGASLAGIADVAALAASRSYAGGKRINCPERGHTLLVLALAQGDRWPEFDWFDSEPGATPGNRSLVSIMNQVTGWLDKEMHIRSQLLPYNVEKGGVYLKGAAILAGLGTIGKNNLLVTPAYGPRVRLRAILIEKELAQTGPIEFAFCESCDISCHRACPQNAFAGGVFDRKRCSMQMREDKLENRVSSVEIAAGFRRESIIYCRACELACVRANP